MSAPQHTDDQLLAWLDECLAADQMTQIESDLRSSEDLRRRVALLIQRRDQGAHTVGEIWRRRRLSCPSRKELGSYLLGAVDEKLSDYIEFHLQTVGCRYCAANLEDLQQSASTEAPPQERRRRIFQSSAGYLRGPRR